MKTMDPDMVRARVEEIRAIQGDDEVAHSREDRLFADVLRAIAERTCENPVECAQSALASLDLDFERWCA